MLVTLMIMVLIFRMLVWGSGLKSLRMRSECPTFGTLYRVLGSSLSDILPNSCLSPQCLLPPGCSLPPETQPLCYNIQSYLSWLFTSTTHYSQSARSTCKYLSHDQCILFSLLASQLFLAACLSQTPPQWTSPIHYHHSATTPEALIYFHTAL